MQLSFYFDQTRCTGCYACGVACKDWNDVPPGPANWRRISHIEEGEFPHPLIANLSDTCNHCENPLCVTVCPAGAIIKRDEDGIVLVNRDKCREEVRCGIITGYEPPLTLSMGEREAPCQVTCPAHLKIPAYLALIAKGKFKEALDLIRRNMPLPSVCGRICNHPCEVQCTRNKLDEPLAVASLRRFVADYANQDTPRPLPNTKGQKVAIVGSGPAGLAAAYDLVRMGYGVTIFEALPVAGGMLAVGIPEYRLPKDILQRDINYIVGLGVEIKTNTPLGPELTLDDLTRRSYSATFIATGAHKGLKLNIPGIETKNVLTGISFLKDVNTGKKVEKIGKKVLVLGGGNVAFDCARTAIRLNAEEVHIACLEARDQMLATAQEIEEAEQEGIIIHPSLSFTRVVCQDECVVGVECLNLKSMKFDQEGMLHIDAITGSEHMISCDTVILAVGQAPSLDFVGVLGGLRLTRQGAIAIDPDTMETSRAGVFAGGDVVQVASAIEAIAAGQKAAIYIDRYLKGEVLDGSPSDTSVKASDIKIEIPPDIKKVPRQKMPLLPVAERVKSFKEVAQGFDQEMAKSEAERCLNCAGSLCRDVCPYGAPQFGAEENAKMQKCNLCLERWIEGKKPICVDACPMRALDADSIEVIKSKYGETRDAVGFAYDEKFKPAVVFKPKVETIGFHR